MVRRVLIEQFHLDVKIPEKTPDAEAEAIRLVLASRAFKADLLRAARAVAATRPELRKATLTLTK
ncbi:MAG: hypothetical protein K2W96_06030 [Gemmataceae bacterium]|nr:hypothetical protein [Gemmataceae bacterium]